MANSISLANKYLPLLDALYKKTSLTASLDSMTQPVSFTNANEVKIFKLSMTGMGDYSRNTGYTTGTVTGTWETWTLAQDRGTKFTVDVMDDEETFNQAFGKLAQEFLRVKVSPEIDAYRFAKYATTAIDAGNYASEDLTSSNIVEAIDTGTTSMDEDEVTEEGRKLYITPTKYTNLKQNSDITRWASVQDDMLKRKILMFDEMEVIKVPQTRFYTAVTLYDGSSEGETDGGYTATSGAYNINFMIIEPSAVVQVAKHNSLKIFSPQVNQSTDGFMVQYRIYHDCFVYENKVAGIYVSHAATGSI